MKKTEQQYLTTPEASNLLRLKPNTLAKRRWRNLPPKFFKAGGRVLYTKAALEEFIVLHKRGKSDD